MTAFEVGKEYEHPCMPYLGLLVESRTAKTLFFKDGEGRKKIYTDKDGDEYVKLGSWRIWATRPFIHPDVRKKQWEEEERRKKEEARQARLAIRIPTKKWETPKDFDPFIIIAWALGNDIPKLTEYAHHIKDGSCMICADPNFNFVNKHLFFKGIEVIVHQGKDDVFTRAIYGPHFCATRDEFASPFKIECTYHYTWGYSLRDDGVWLLNGKVHEPDWESMNY